jgi:hypothetical protein
VRGAAPAFRRVHGLEPQDARESQPEEGLEMSAVQVVSEEVALVRLARVHRRLASPLVHAAGRKRHAALRAGDSLR